MGSSGNSGAAGAYQLAVSAQQPAPGIVTSVPAKIHCAIGYPTDPMNVCEALFPAGTSVTLHAAGFSGSAFKYWDGDCKTAGSQANATVVLNQNMFCQAIFGQ